MTPKAYFIKACEDVGIPVTDCGGYVELDPDHDDDAETVDIHFNETTGKFRAIVTW